MTEDESFVRLTDTTLRDGSHAMRHRFTVGQVRAAVHGLDAAGVPVIEVAHGDGLGGSSFTYGFSAVDELDLIAAAVEEAHQARIAVLLLPGVGTTEDLHAAHERGASVARIATHSSEANISIQHFKVARALGFETVGFLMMAHMLDPDLLAHQARVMVDAGAQCVYVTDSAGALVLDEAADRVAAMVAEIGGDAQVGFHGHNNLALGVANSVLAYRAGARQIDCATAALGAGSGNSPTEVLVAVFNRLGISTGVDLGAALSVAEEVVRPFMLHVPTTDRPSVVMGYAGVYSSFLLHARQAAERYGVPVHELLAEAGHRRYVGGQEDLLIDIALSLADSRAEAKA
ncbi:MAG: 4-hydroxy-2-oxovalerate aldolase [Acidimicrobiales bacterium]